MALALAGNGGSVKFNSGSAEINFLNNWKISINGAELDTTKFGDTDKRRAVGLKSGSGSAGGTFISGDTTGQDALWGFCLQLDSTYTSTFFTPWPVRSGEGFRFIIKTTQSPSQTVFRNQI